MKDLKLIARFARSIRYKPGWTIEAEPDPIMNDVQVYITARVQDARSRTKKLARLDGGTVLKPGITPVAVWRAVERAIATMEEHERLEWLKWRGARIFDPHAHR